MDPDARDLARKLTDSRTEIDPSLRALGPALISHLRQLHAPSVFRPRDAAHAFEESCINLGKHLIIDYLEKLVQDDKPAPFVKPE